MFLSGLIIAVSLFLKAWNFEDSSKPPLVLIGAGAIWWGVLFHFLLMPDVDTCSRFADVISCALLMLAKH